MTPEVKQCPFCGGNPESRHVSIGGYEKAYEVRCHDCGVGTDYEEKEQAAIGVWNRRVL